MAVSQDTSIAYGSEFWPLEDLQRVFGQHELFPFFENVHKNGMQYHLTEDLTE